MLHYLASCLLVLQLTRRVTSSMVDNDQASINLRLSMKETLLVDLGNLLQNSNNAFTAVNNQSWDANFSSSKHPVKMNWMEFTQQRPSNLTNECFFYNAPYFYSNVLSDDHGTRPGIISRQLSRRNGFLYVSTAYNSLVQDPQAALKKYVNRLETLVFKYNSTHLNFVRADIKDIEQANGTYNHMQFEERCLQLHYVHLLQEQVMLCFRRVSLDDSYHLVFQRPTRSTSTVISKFKTSDLPKDWEKTQMKIFPTQDGAFEVFVHYQYASSFWLFNFNEKDVFGTQVYKVNFNISTIRYVASTLLVFNTFSPDRPEFYAVYFVHRYPGARIKFEEIIMLAETMFVNGYASNEDTEIILETANWIRTYHKGLLVTTTYSVYSYDLLTKNLNQIQGMDILYGCPATNYGMPLKIDSFVMGESNMLLINLHYYVTNSLYLYQPASVNAWGLTYTLNSYAGVGSLIALNQSYNLYNTDNVHDMLHDQFLMLTFNQMFDGKISSFCTVLKQRMNKGELEVKYRLPPEAEYKLLNLSFVGKTNPNMIPCKINIEFFKPDDLEINQHQIWATSNLTDIQVPVGQTVGSVTLRDLARGSFIVKKIAGVGMQIDFTGTSVANKQMIERASLMNITSGIIEGTYSLMLQSVESLFAVMAVTDNFKKTVIFLTKSSDPRTYVFEAGPSGISFKQFASLSDKVTRIVPLKPNFFMLFMESGGMSTFNSVDSVLARLPYPGVNCIDVSLLFHWHIRKSIVCLDANLMFTVYYLDDLLARSLSNSILRMEFKLTPVLTLKSKLLTSQSYSGKVFAFTPRNQREGKPQLSAFFLETSERNEMMLACTLDLVDPNESKSGSVFRAVGAYIRRDRIIVHFRANAGDNGLAVYVFSEDLVFKLIKYVVLPLFYHVDSISGQIYEMKTHYVSLSQINPDPCLFVRVREGGISGPANVLLFDPFSSELDSFPTVVLPRGSSSEEVAIFPIISYSSSQTQTESIGLLHYRKHKESLMIANNDAYAYWIQFVSAEHPRVKFELSVKGIASHSDIFDKKVGVLQETMSTDLESHPLIGRQKPTTILKKTVNLFQKPLGSEAGSSAETIKRTNSYKIVLTKFKDAFNNKDWVEVERIKFRGMFNRSILTWQYSPESLFDHLTDTLRFTTPFSLREKLTDIPNMNGLTKISRFCMSYKMVEAQGDAKKSAKSANSSTSMVCREWGTVFHMEGQLAIMHSSDLKKMSSATLLRVNASMGECADPFVMESKLTMFCMQGSLKVINQIDLITMTPSEPKIIASYTPVSPIGSESSVKIMEGIGIITQSQSMVDSMMKRSTGMTALSVFCKAKSLITNPTDPDNKAFLLILDRTLKTDLIFSMFYLKLEELYIFESLVLMTGSQISMSLFSSATRVLRKADCSFFFVTKMPSETLQFTIGGTREAKQQAIMGSRLQSIVFDKEEMYLESKPLNFTSYFIQSQNFNMTVGSPMYINALLYMPNYHSYLIRYVNYLHRCQTAIYKLHNPFAGLGNSFNQRRPECYRWACVTVLNFKNDSYLALYDLEYEKIRSQNRSNFDEIFNITVNCSEKSPIDFHNLDLVPAKYTFSPLSVMQVSAVETTFFDTNFTNSKDPEDLQLTVYHKDRSISLFSVNRNFKILVRNPYVSSEFVDVKVQQPFGESQILRFSFEDFRETDYFKYWVLLAVLATIGTFYAAWTLGCLKKEQNENMRLTVPRDEVVEELIRPEDAYRSPGT